MVMAGGSALAKCEERREDQLPGQGPRGRKRGGEGETERRRGEERLFIT